VYDGLENGEMDIEEILSLLPACMPEGSETIAGYEVYAVDEQPMNTSKQKPCQIEVC
jgi:hypothetical protein